MSLPDRSALLVSFMYELYNGKDDGFEDEYKELESDFSLDSLILAIKQMGVLT